MKMNAYPWNLFYIVLTAGLFGMFAVIPYTLALDPTLLDKIREKQASKARPLPPVLILSLAITLSRSVRTLGCWPRVRWGWGCPSCKGSWRANPFWINF
jgi:hypothetical protein